MPMRDKKPLGKKRLASNPEKQERLPEEITVTISRTIQIRQYEPVAVTVTERHTPEAGEDPNLIRNEVYNQVAKSVAKYMDRELKRYSEE